MPDMIHVALHRKLSRRHCHTLSWVDPDTGKRIYRSARTRDWEKAKSLRFHVEKILREQHGHEQARRRRNKDRYYQKHRGECRHGWIFRDRRWVKDPYTRRLAQLFLRWQEQQKLTCTEIARRCWCERIHTKRRQGKNGEFIEWTIAGVKRVMQDERVLQEQETVTGPVYPQELIDRVKIKGRLHSY